MTPPTPGPYRVLEIIPAERGGLCGRAPEGHDTITSDSGGDCRIEILSTTDHMRDVFGSGHGGHIATVPIPLGLAARAQAIANARLLAAAANLLAVCKMQREFIESARNMDNAVQVAVLADVDGAIALAEGKTP